MVTPAPLFTVDAMQFFGREPADYQAMFGIGIQDLIGLRVLDCPAGPGSFVAEAAARGVDVIGVDPLYDQPLTELLDRGRRDVRHTIDRMRRKRDCLADLDLDAYERSKLRALDTFGRDFTRGLALGRYVAASLPHLPFPDRHFHRTLSAHLLFTYSDPEQGGILPGSPFTPAWHLLAAGELMRVTLEELRLYPTTTRWETPARHPVAEQVAQMFVNQGLKARFETSTFARGNHMSDHLNACLVVTR
jgi:hypothetical protein